MKMDIGKKKTNREDFGLFKDESEYWIRFFGCLGWRIDYEHATLLAESLAEYNSDIEGRCALITMNKEFPEISYNKKEIRRTGFHEIVEIMFSRLISLAIDRSATKQEIIEAKHELIRIFENSIFEVMYEKRKKEGLLDGE